MPVGTENAWPMLRRVRCLGPVTVKHEKMGKGTGMTKREGTQNTLSDKTKMGSLVPHIDTVVQLLCGTGQGPSIESVSTYWASMCPVQQLRSRMA